MLPEDLGGSHALFSDVFTIVELEVKVALRLVPLVERVEGPDELVADGLARVALPERAVNFHGEIAPGALVLIQRNQISSPVLRVALLVRGRCPKCQA